MTDQEFQPQEEPQPQAEPQPREERQPYQPGGPFYEEKAQEKYEKEDEKLREKHSQDPLDALVWALILIWAGLVFLASNLNWLSTFEAQLSSLWNTNLDLSVWWVIMAGAGVLVFIEAIIRTLVPAYRTSTGGNFFLAAIFLGVGLGGIFGWGLIWPFILIGMGLAALTSALVRKR